MAGRRWLSKNRNRRTSTRQSSDLSPFEIGVTMSFEIVQIVPYLPPTPSGVGDYAFLLARELRAAHGIDTRFLLADGSWSGERQIDGFALESIANCNASRFEKLLRSSSTAAPVILHYVGYGYEKRGCPLW